VKVQEVSSSCDSLSASPMTGVNTLTSSVSCSGTKAESFKIDCGNGQVFTGTGSGE